MCSETVLKVVQVTGPGLFLEVSEDIMDWISKGVKGEAVFAIAVLDLYLPCSVGDGSESQRRS